MNALRRFWPVIALLAGVVLAFFEIRRVGGVTADNVFWVVVAGLIVLLALIDLFQKRPPGSHPDAGPPP